MRIRPALAAAMIAAHIVGAVVVGLAIDADAAQTPANVAGNAGPVAVATTRPVSLGVASNGTCDPMCMLAVVARQGGVAL